jgi:radical SAM superfamily enzyme YgiQ (UPF0313 family)
MKILLAYPYFLYERAAVENIDPPPFGLYFLAATLLEHGHEVLIKNWHDRRDDPSSIESELRDERPDVLGLSLFHGNRWGGIDAARIAKRLDPDVTVVAGGVGATFLDEHLLRHFSEIDYVVRGEGELSFPALLDWLVSDRSADPAGLKGVSFRSRGRIVRTPDAPRVETLDALPNPARFFTYQHLALSRGCPGKCVFCGSPRFWGNKVRFHSAAYFVDQIELLAEKGVRFFYVSDDTFTLKRELVREVCEEILRRGLRVEWAAISRVDRVDAETLALMRRAGCIQLSFGVESGSVAIRGRLNKRFDNQAVERAFSLATRYGILARAYFIYGCPGEDEESIDESIELIQRIKPLIALFHVLTLFPGAKLYDERAQVCGFDDAIWLERNEDIFYFETDPALPQDRVMALGKRLKDAYFQALPAFVQDIELVDEPGFASLHADFLSRLGMTFHYGDYAALPMIKEPALIAEACYRRALGYAQNARASLGLGLLSLKRRDFAAAASTLGPAAQAFPEDLQLCLYLGISLLNLGDFELAVSALEKAAAPGSPCQRDAEAYLARSKEGARRFG